ncbi:hypothetical protein FIU22_01695 [Parabacteroides distasonis]|uniref:hypothetical protein n=1 Tax=Parabacteroides distasonis TaxID=823 RepID=UPI001560C1B6|nr:hypothetical protein [Parabacteroides distasonis]QKH96389.1 hypothetical protein FIU22_01695 [Parabacteroides distasonis]
MILIKNFEINMEIRNLIIKGTRKLYRNIKKPVFKVDYSDLDRDSANEKILKLLEEDRPCMISRFGSGEIGIVNNYLTTHSNSPLFKRCYDYITDDTGLPWWDKLFYKSMRLNAGIFPESIEILDRFAERYLQDIPEIDLLGSFNYTEKFMPLRKGLIKVHLECLYPFWTKQPWTLALKGKKVLVVHPFVDTIESQYARRELLFEDTNILPSFELKTLRAVQSNAGNDVIFCDWFEALTYMENEISGIDFDICILGCGAYGLSLAATIKRMGKKAVHMGGGSQLLVVHPFVDTIESQYARRELLFEDTNILPSFELKTLRAVQSNAGNDVIFCDWFEALTYMENEISGIDFDICILGCGAYGLSLAATIKRMGKKAVHMGGGSQLLFGIKGKRWDNDAYHWKDLPQLETNYSSLYNKYWVRPSQSERPKSASKVEGACYW